LWPDQDHPNYNCTVTTDHGGQRRVYANWIHNHDLDHWQGWHCDAGATRFYIDSNFDVWSGECQNDFLGNALTGWQTKNNTVCHRRTCTGCTDDLIVKKYQPE
jgi:hypothetical protein